ncbi:D-alanyl-D-alanine carboxypeptidase family protein [Candidatus Poriferisodalis sp.]|uniref:D-alanyl-D-alanine carboxypeptidase family protein n=1 Tax=Candidatus Poriferisodalis sp. TaxID=3101277 RepID=UPI003C6ED016
MPLPAGAVAGPYRSPVVRNLSYPGDVLLDGSLRSAGSAPELFRDNAIREAFRRAAVDIGVAYWVTDLKHEPNLDGLLVGYRPPSGNVGEADASELSRLVTLASRRELVAADAWHQHVTRLLARDTDCPIGRGPQQCPALLLWLVPHFEPATDGALEMLADSRTRGTAVNGFDYLNAAFEIDVWRPAGVHPMLAEAARNAAAVMRLRTASHPHPCGVTALWVVAAVSADVPEITRIGYGEWHRGDRVVELRSVTRNAAVRGCRASAALAEQYDELGIGPPAWPFWERHLVEAMSDATAAGLADTLDRMTAGSLRSSPRSPLPDDAPALTPYRACDQQSPVLPFSEAVVVAGFRVAPCLADSLRALLDAASADGIKLKGWGWRSTLTQIRLRRQYCPLPPPDSDRYWLQLSLMESNECTPPVSKPRSSMHESGRAVDFTCGTSGASMRPGVSCFEWLLANAHHFGLYNFVLEPWHWSTNGR